MFVGTFNKQTPALQIVPAMLLPHQLSGSLLKDRFEVYRIQLHGILLTRPGSPPANRIDMLKSSCTITTLKMSLCCNQMRLSQSECEKVSPPLLFIQLIPLRCLMLIK